MFNIKKIIIEKINEEISNELNKKENIIQNQKSTINELANRLSKNIDEMDSTIVDLNRSLNICEINDRKPEKVYTHTFYAKYKIKDSIATSKQLLNHIGIPYIPKTNFSIKKLNNQEGGRLKWLKEECFPKD